MSITGLDGEACSPDDRRSPRARARLVIPGWFMASFGIICIASGCGVMEETTSVDVVFDRTGTLQRDGAFTGMTEIVADKPLSPRIGDNVVSQSFCAFVSINLNSLPATANVTRVVLNLKATIFAGDPFGDFGSISVDHVNVLNGVNTSDYIGGTIEANIAAIPSFPTTTRQNVAIDVTGEVNVDRAAGRPISSFRFRFDAAPSNDALGDQVAIEASPDDPNQRPSAVVTFRR